MAIRIFLVMAFFALVVLLPVNARFRDFRWDNDDEEPNPDRLRGALPSEFGIFGKKDGSNDGGKDRSIERAYLWSYVVFTYLFVALTLYSINWETVRIIRLRQNYLGSQSTVTDRTFRLTGIPISLRNEARLKALIEKLGMGTVETISLCCDWKELDDLVKERDRLLRSLEAAWAKYLRSQHTPNKNNQRQTRDGDAAEGDEESAENSRLLAHNPDQPHVLQGERPQVTLRSGLLGLRRRKVDAIDYYEEQLRRTDDKIIALRKEEFKPTDMAMVTMNSVASCQMFVQARIDPRPGRLLTKPTPSPSDMVWRNTYEVRGIRRLKSWAITIFIAFLTLIWIFPTAFLASFLSMCYIEKSLPPFAEWLSNHSVILSLVQNGGPTLIISLLNIAVPYLYDYLSNRQGMVSQGDVELSLISKNFFFVFFNTFFVFAVSRTGIDFLYALRDFLSDTSKIPAAIAADVESMSIFYANFIILQGIGLMPFRILEVGSVVLYPIYRALSSTPRDYLELQKPPDFQYGFYLPTALLVFNLCLIYSVLRWGFAILCAGVAYFTLGYFTFKYMLLYAMDQPQHATGGAWRIICHRIVIGLVIFEVVMIGQIASLAAWFQSVSIFPLIPFTIWYSYYFKRRFEPLTKCIALRNIQSQEGDGDDAAVLDDEDDEGVGALISQGPRPSPLMRRGSTLDELREQGLTFVNPSLVMP